MTLDGVDDPEEPKIADFRVEFESGETVATSGGEFPEGFKTEISGYGKFSFSINQGRHLGGTLRLKMGNPSFGDHEAEPMITEISLTPASDE